jgi:membrane-bound lytic murein transglycosylase B
MASPGYEAFLEGVRRDASATGISAPTLARALNFAGPNARVLQLDRHQPEFTLTWAEYAQRVLPQSRLARARDAASHNQSSLGTVRARFGVDPGVIVGIWGLESSFGDKQGTFNVCDALATLAFDGRRRTFFRGELIKSLLVIDKRGVDPAGMLGSYAGAMGQPQFMPSAYLRYARSFDGGDRADIWTNRDDVFASVANYLGQSGWREGEPWGQPVTSTRPVDPAITGRGHPRSLSEWSAMGIRRADGRNFSRGDVEGSLLMPDGESGPAFMVYRNFDAIRRYNPSDFYALAVGLLGDAIT